MIPISVLFLYFEEEVMVIIVLIFLYSAFIANLETFGF